MTVGEAARLLQLRLKDTAGDESAREAKLLLCGLIGVEPPALHMHRGMELTRAQLDVLKDWADRRESGEPLQYILGEWSFMGLPIRVDAAVLIPRPETECLCEEALRLSGARRYSSALDLCTGSGCIAVALAKLGGLKVVATDVDGDCLRVAGANAALNDVELTLLQGDLFGPVEGCFDLITVNPPYLSEADMSVLQRELAFEPAKALYGGRDGLDFYRRIADGYRAHLSPGGALLMEIGSTQGNEVLSLFPGARLCRDYGGSDRYFVVEPGV